MTYPLFNFAEISVNGASVFKLKSYRDKSAPRGTKEEYTMSINRTNPDSWKKDTAASVDMYNEWFMNFAPKTFRETRIGTSKSVEDALRITGYLCKLTPEILKKHPKILPILRMATCPPIARDRLIGLSGVSKSLVQNMEDVENPHTSPRMPTEQLNSELNRIINTINRMIDPDIFVWLSENRSPVEIEINRSSTIVADRLCGAVSDPIIRNAQEKRQLATIEEYLKKKGYSPAEDNIKFNEMKPGTYSFRTNVQVQVSPGSLQTANIPVDVLICPLTAKQGELPIMIEAKSAGDYTNVNKRRKEEATKIQQLKHTYGDNVTFILFLCGYFDSAYLGYEAAEGIDWIWEHRITDMDQLGI
jgi:hypothetical protein